VYVSGFDDWHAEAYPRLVAQLTALIGDRAQAQDVVQEAFVRAWERRVDLPTRGERDAWIRTTAYRLSRSVPGGDCAAGASSQARCR
jgi:RNA polymerase sigma-70 factor (ECF subfamily)